MLTPIDVGGHILQNRVAITAHRFDINAYSPAQDGEQYLAYLRSLVSGGVGLAMTQAIPVPPVDGEHPFSLHYLQDRLSQAAEIIHESGALALVQTIHKGITGSSGGDATIAWNGRPMWGFSAAQSETGPEVGHEMTSREVESLIEGWGRTAELAIECGFDGVELHGGHGYLLHQSISPWANRRDDEWGDHLSFWKALLLRIRAGIGPSALLSARVPTKDLRSPHQGGNSDQRLREIACELVATGHISLLNPSEGSSPLHYPRTVGSYRRPHADFMEGVAELRLAIDGRVPVLGVGRIVTVEEAETALQNGNCDIVGMTRAHIADPRVLPNLRQQRTQETRTCVGANHCIDRISVGTYAMCFHNPDVGREHQLLPLRATHRKDVLVVGAGPAGLAAAVTAAANGHRVKLIERELQLGGRLATIDPISSAVELVESVRLLERQARSLEVEIAVGMKASSELFDEAPFDAIILATGSKPGPSTFKTDGSIPYVPTDQAVRSARATGAREVLVYDTLGNDEGAVVVEQLAALGCHTTIVTPLPAVGSYLGITHATDHVPRLLDLGCTLYERSTISAILDHEASIGNTLNSSEARLRPNLVVLACDRMPEIALQLAAERACPDVRVVGDATAPGLRWLPSSKERTPDGAWASSGLPLNPASNSGLRRESNNQSTRSVNGTKWKITWNLTPARPPTAAAGKA
nr:FAD-dependent oxidoreductase [Pseudarthrobacter sp. B4EP4b]